MTQKKASYFISPLDAPKFTQMVGLETTILTGLHGEKMMMVLNTTLPGHIVPSHSHPHEQIGMVLLTRRHCALEMRNILYKKGISTVYLRMFHTVTPA